MQHSLCCVFSCSSIPTLSCMQVEALKLLIEDKVEDKAQDNTMMNESIEGMMQSTRTCTAFVELNQACIAEIESIMNK